LTQKNKLLKNEFSFKTDGILRQNCFEQGKYWDSHIISLIDNEREVK
jgi:hypothetical protein